MIAVRFQVLLVMVCLHLQPFLLSIFLVGSLALARVICVVPSLTPQLPPLPGSPWSLSLPDVAMCGFDCPVCVAS